MDEMLQAVARAITQIEAVPKVLQLTTSAIRPGYQYVDHYYRDVFEIVYVLEGTINIGVESQYARAKSGDCFVIFPSAVHNVFSNKKESCRIVDFRFKPGDLSVVDGGGLAFFRAAEDGELKYFRFSDNGAFRNLLEGIALGMGRDDAYARAGLRLDFCRMYVMLSEVLDKATQLHIKEESSLAETAHKLIYENYRNAVKVGEVSGNLGISSRHLSRLFHRDYGMSVRDYINLLKIDKARELLANGEMNITQIAFHLGFNSSDYFTSFFKKQIGVSPREYRKSMNPHPDPYPENPHISAAR